MLRVALALSSLALLGIAWVSLPRTAEQAVARAPAVAKPAAPVRASPQGPRGSPPPLAASERVRFIAIGGGATPESTEVSLEQDLALAGGSLRGPGRLLFAGGSDAQSVRVLDATLDASSLLVRIGDFFAPRSGRGSRYRKPAFAASPATLAEVERALGETLGAGSAPVIVYVASHGEQGERARDNYVVLWGDEPLTVARLDALSEHATRPVRLVIASCFSGGFAELAFAGADPERGVTQAPRCGVFAGTWDRETSGCDPNPDRRAQESYSIHLLHALRGEDRDGRALPKREVDFDADGRVSLLEAHTRARIAGVSIDVPTTTSERYLRHVQKARRKAAPGFLPEETAVIEQLGARLGLFTHAAALTRSAFIVQALDELDRALTAAEQALDQAQAALSVELLGRWPVLDDAYHPDFAATLANNGIAITRMLDEGDRAHAYAEALARVDELAARYAAAQSDDAVVIRLLRAYETLSLASALRLRGGRAWDEYAKLLACERSLIE